MMKILLFSFLFIFFSSISYAKEVDSFSQRHLQIEDSAYLLNMKVEQIMDKAIKIVNREHGCNEDEMYQSLNDHFSSFFVSHFERLVEKDPFIKKLSPLSDTVYQYMSFFDFGADMTTVNFSTSMSSLVNINGNYVGTDKFSHFFTEGFFLYEIAYLKKKGVIGAISFGERKEATFWGLYQTGIFSYADLSANYNGMNFWKDILKNPRTNSPFIACVNGKFLRIKNMDWSKYSDASFDEGINCNRFRTKNLKSFFEKRIRELESLFGKSLNCPISKKKCIGLKSKYGKVVSKYILHPECFSADITIK